MGAFFWVMLAIVLIGALNWGLVGFFNYNLVAAIFGGEKRPTTRKSARVVYGLVGLAALLIILILIF